MVESALEEVRGHIAESGKHIEHAREVLEDKCEDLKDQSRRAFRTMRHTAEDLAEDAEHLVKKRPLPAMAGAVAAGVALGFLVGWLLARRD